MTERFINWGKPLRVVETKEPVKFWRSFGDGIEVTVGDRHFMVHANGWSVSDDNLSVENMPRIVERWMAGITFNVQGDYIAMGGSGLFKQRPENYFGRLARVLIEEPE
jgi:hypothetical protein